MIAPSPPRAFKQQRAAQTYEALLAESAKVFAEKGFDQAQTPDIAAAAGVSTGAFYRYFRDKQHIFVEMMTAHLQKQRASVHAELSIERFVGTDARAGIEMVLDVLFRSVAQNPALHRVYYSVSLVDPEVAALRAAAEADERKTLARLIDAAIPKERVPSPEAAALIIQIAALETAAERAGLRPRTGPRVADDDVKNALRDILHRYLFAPLAEEPKEPKKKKK